MKLKVVFFVSLLYWISFFVSSAPLPPSVQNEIEAQQQQRLENIKQQQNQLETSPRYPHFLTRQMKMTVHALR
ncbi:hypothetical protein ACFSJQ_19340 [Vibrio olivae]